jgi:FKBP-type peptidyl-prolyl cis-trans isomerase FkpA
VNLVRLIRSAAAVGVSALLIVGMSACSDTPTSPSGSVPYSQTDMLEGTGTVAATGNVLSVHYTGWLYNASQPGQKGGQFDSSAGFDPFSFTLGAGQVISGWDRGLVGMKVGGIRRLVLPPSLAYGSVRSGVIPPEGTLVFEIELVAVQ